MQKLELPYIYIKVKAGLLNVLRGAYDRNRACMRQNQLLSEWFSIELDCNKDQWCPLRWLIIVFMENCIKKPSHLRVM